jgi:hypothetical protein
LERCWRLFDVRRFHPDKIAAVATVPDDRPMGQKGETGGPVYHPLSAFFGLFFATVG